MYDETVSEILKEMVLKSKGKYKQVEGGMEAFLESLEDSDTFYAEAFEHGRKDAFMRLAEEYESEVPEGMCETAFWINLNNIWNAEHRVASELVENSKGGMEKFLNDLQESSDFYEEAYALGRVDALNEFHASALPYY